MGPARSRTVVKPASSMSRAFFAAWSVRSWVRAPTSAQIALGSSGSTTLTRWTWRSMSPGMTVAPAT